MHRLDVQLCNKSQEEGKSFNVKQMIVIQMIACFVDIYAYVSKVL